MKLSEEITSKSKAQKFVGHNSAAVVTHEQLEEWAERAQRLESLLTAAKVLQSEFVQTRKKWKKEGSHVYEVLKLNEFEQVIDSFHD